LDTEDLFILHLEYVDDDHYHHNRDLETEHLFILHQEYVDDDHDDDDDDVMIRKTMKTFSLSQALCTATGILLELHLPRFHTNVDAYCIIMNFRLNHVGSVVQMT